MNKERLFNSNHRMKRILQYLLLISVVLYLTISCQKEKEEDLLPLAALVAGRSTSTTATNGGTTTFTLGGTVSGLSGTVVLTNGGVDKSVTANGAYTFDSSVNSGSTYNVTIKTQPTGQVCSVSNGTGTANANVSNIDMSCCTIKGGASKCAISLTGIVTTLAGGTTSGSDDGTGTSARFSSPIGITSDGTNLYVTDSGNHTIRKIDFNGEVTTIVGAGSIGADDGFKTSAKFYYPRGITTDGKNLYVTDYGNHTIRIIE